MFSPIFLNLHLSQFLADGFDLMLFHYDGMVNEWNDLEWSRNVIHISAVNQTKLYVPKFSAFLNK